MSGKRSNGEGCLRKRPNGTWELQVMIGHQADGRRKLKSFYGKTQKEVKDKAKRFFEELANAPKMNGDMLFKDWAAIWYESMKGQVSDTAYDNYQYTLRFLKDYFGEMRLVDIRAMTVEACLKDAVAEGRSKSFLSKYRGMMFQIMKKAEANDLIVKNPVASADRIRTKEIESRKDSFSVAEVRRLMEILPDDRLGQSIRLMIGTGMRTQELMGLQPQHIDKDGSYIHIRQAVTMVKGTPKIGPPKTRSSVRDIPVPQALREYAIKLRTTTHEFVWYGEKTPICNPSVFRKQFKMALYEVGEVRLLSPHCCRHTYISQMQALGVDMETIQNLCGHADLGMTEHYLHVQREIKETAAGQLNELFKKSEVSVA